MLTRNRLRDRANAVASSVLGTPELLEHICTHLDIRTLLTAAQRVNRQWHAIITNSPWLQRFMFLQPHSAGNAETMANPLLREAFPPWYVGKPRCSYKRGFDREAFSNLPMCKEPSRMRRFMHPKASWRRMLLTQPPTTKLGVWKSDQEAGCMPDFWFKVLEFNDGLRMGKLYDLSQGWVGTPFLAMFAIYWDSKDPDTLGDLYYLKVSPPAIAASHKCGAAVDIILYVERWDFNRGGNRKEGAQFRKKFEYPHKKGEFALQPTGDWGYREAHDWAKELDSTSDFCGAASASENRRSPIKLTS